MVADQHPSPAEEISEHEKAHLLRESMAVGLYIAISLLASLGTLVDLGEGADSPLPALWGILVGLLLVHWFAFSLAQFATDVGNSRRQDLRITAAGLGGGLKVGVLVTVVDLVFSERETGAVTIALLGYIVVAAAIVARTYDAGRLRTVVIVVSITALGLAIVGAKNLLAGY
ncbi:MULTISPECIES: hypothetical protein [Micrococcaceae]|uniref:hypothetical protein n=1 Tax=Micrococcaceae TaxID=1268 RepID=UPI0016115CBB|nr:MULTISPECIES: hypothetical protein [Micrococcaceae]MBB5750860.1 hypothetical protein [Micrococcus sp. TA1]HRO30832.1 hypothetical protein [Citricoccus sp.]HRO92411.1 hypothetical protein [Citricoccus sp.]